MPTLGAKLLRFRRATGRELVHPALVTPRNALLGETIYGFDLDAAPAAYGWTTLNGAEVATDW